MVIRTAPGSRLKTFWLPTVIKRSQNLTHKVNGWVSFCTCFWANMHRGLKVQTSECTLETSEAWREACYKGRQETRNQHRNCTQLAYTLPVTCRFEWSWLFHLLIYETMTSTFVKIEMAYDF